MLRNMNAMKMARCWAACNTVARPEPNVSTLTIAVSARRTISLPPKPRLTGESSQMDAIAIALIVRPMLSIA